uniref:HTH_48 domain-containing protein n=1 Tax=Steinernema glaseri TaxID=37863 RepID=A0A1I7ZZE4_9BILA
MFDTFEPHFTSPLRNGYILYTHSYLTNKKWQCTRPLAKCLTRSLRADSFAATSLFPMRTLVLVVHSWFRGAPPAEISAVAGVNRQSAENWTLLFRAACRRFVEAEGPKMLEGELEVAVFDSRRQRMTQATRILIVAERDDFEMSKPPILLLLEEGEHEDHTQRLFEVIAEGSRLHLKGGATFFDAETLRRERRVEIVVRPEGPSRIDALVAEVKKMGHRSTQDHLKFFEVVYLLSKGDSSLRLQSASPLSSMATAGLLIPPASSAGSVDQNLGVVHNGLPEMTFTARDHLRHLATFLKASWV